MFIFQILVAVFGLAFAVLCVVLFWRRLRPRLIMTVLLLVEFFAVCIAFSPSVGLSISSISADVRWQQNPNAETEREMRYYRAWDLWRPRIVWTVVIANGLLIVVYAKHLLNRRAA